ncbi:hypothetical protein C8J57DRAFT_1298296 [Mycena rebaudengoi]|nr:hypothetical protein C8J57DRAFT_1298296 [Mycena rebaudengoi]
MVPAAPQHALLVYLGILLASTASAWIVDTSRLSRDAASGIEPATHIPGPSSTFQYFHLIDSDSDGRISLAELQDMVAFMWNDHDQSDRARATFGVAHPTDFIATYDADGDGLLSIAEFSMSMDEVKPDINASQCARMKTHLDTCKTHQILKCSSYLNTAEQMCRMNHRNVIEQCILSSPCGSICDCVAQAEKAAHGQSVLALEYPDGHQEYFSGVALRGANTSALGVHQPEKRFFFLFLGLVIAAIINISVSAALLSASEIVANTGRQVSFMDFDIWNSDSKDPPPSCSVYVFWSRQCGAIGSGSARGCSDGGSRLYGNSCKDHFRYGSRGCGFLGLGCRSLCYAVNDQGCPCSIFDNWLEQDNVNYPGNDIESIHVEKISDCRNGCGSNPACLAFVIPPPDGTDGQVNCFMKGALGSFTASSGVTSFLKIATNTKTCPSSLVGADDQFGIFNRRDVGNDLALRVDENGIGKAFPFDPNDPRYLIIATFITVLYRQFWINQEQVQRTSFQTTLNAIGAMNLVPDPAEPVAQTANPRWRPSDGWRILNIFRAIMAQARTSNSPVTAVLAQQGQAANSLDVALFPQAIRQLFQANEAAIANNGQAWAGATGSTTAYPGVLTTHAGPSNLGFYQRGAAGPFSLEAAFIFATQLAGINWVQYNNQLARNRVRRATFWLNAIVPRGTGAQAVPQCLRQYTEGQEFSNDPGQSRRLGYLARAGAATGDIGAGIYFVLDVDGQNDINVNPTRNVFIFAMHTIDPRSRINVPNAAALRNLQYQTYTPESVRPGATPNGPPAGPTPRAQQRFFAHGHAAWVPFNQIQAFLEQDPNGAQVEFPVYTEIVGSHIYILSEDENNIWPRSDYLKDDRDGGKKHDEL